MNDPILEKLVKLPKWPTAIASIAVFAVLMGIRSEVESPRRHVVAAIAGGFLGLAIVRVNRRD